MSHRSGTGQLQTPPAASLFRALAPLILLALACSLGGQGSVSRGVPPTRTPLPTFTPTAFSTPQPVAMVEAPGAAEGAGSAVAGTPTRRPMFGPAPASTPTPAAGGELAALPEATPTRTPLPTYTPAPAEATPRSTSLPAPEATPTKTPPTDEATPGGFSPPAATPTQTPLPPALPTATATAVPSATPTAAPTAAPSPTPAGPPTAEPSPVPSPAAALWSFISVRASDQAEDLYLVGEMVNNTGQPQTQVNVSGVFYDLDNEVIEDEIDTLSYVPVEVIPAGAHIPFELVVDSGRPVYRFDLVALSTPGDDPPRQDFQFSNLDQRTEAGGLYCVAGQVHNPGAALDEYLIVLAIFYDDQNAVTNFGKYAVPDPEHTGGDTAAPFELCLDPDGREIARYELRAFGR